ncbi:hypothetical protein T440DRAFT_135181 [Plenodomus tracheiphilus IPT5]|uniref:Uncharacterized protein n=1 Tax=Plenodomus tracheiphilus IPT5 TaxID=1408161 RepID=A0A6A7B4J5_9PLEO|nr:hypothetical protein T440DRAFT_135181 [Plenodomus tracheiphilus IPT5]
MASRDHTAQFQEPPVSPLPSQGTSEASKTSDVSRQFQEPISPPPSNDVSGDSKSTAEKVKEKVKKPFVKEEDEVKPPELEAAEEVLQDKGMI